MEKGCFKGTTHTVDCWKRTLYVVFNIFTFIHIFVNVTSAEHKWHADLGLIYIAVDIALYHVHLCDGSDLFADLVDYTGVVNADSLQTVPLPASKTLMLNCINPRYSIFILVYITRVKSVIRSKCFIHVAVQICTFMIWGWQTSNCPLPWKVSHNSPLILSFSF